MERLDQSGRTREQLSRGRLPRDKALEVGRDDLAVMGGQMIQEGPVTLRIAACSGGEEHNSVMARAAKHQYLHLNSFTMTLFPLTFGMIKAANHAPSAEMRMGERWPNARDRFSNADARG